MNKKTCEICGRKLIKKDYYNLIKLLIPFSNTINIITVETI